MMYKYSLPVLAAATTVLAQSSSTITSAPAAASSTVMNIFMGEFSGEAYGGSILSVSGGSTQVVLSCMSDLPTAASSGMRRRQATATGSAASAASSGFENDCEDPNSGCSYSDGDDGDDGDDGLDACPFPDGSFTVTIGNNAMAFDLTTSGVVASESCTWAGTTGSASCTSSFAAPLQTFSDATYSATTDQGASVWPASSVTLSPITVTAGLEQLASASSTGSSSGSSSGSGSSGTAKATGVSASSSGASSTAKSTSSGSGAAPTMLPAGFAVAGGLMGFVAMAL